METTILEQKKEKKEKDKSSNYTKKAMKIIVKF